MADDERRRSLLDDVAEADKAIWDDSGPTSIRSRNEAAQAAVEAGWTPEEIAARLGVQPDDVRDWVTVSDWLK